MSPPKDVLNALTKLGVSDTAFQGLTTYVAVLDKWRQRINLIGPGSIDDIWRRHVLDSAQAWPQITETDGPLLDLGSGAGLPGLIFSILGASNVTLIDSDQRKAVFLREAARAVGVKPRIVAQRFDAALSNEAGSYDVVTARAVASITKLMPILRKALKPEGYALLLKGAQTEKELTEAQKSWTLRYALTPSITGGGGQIVKIWGIAQHDRGS
jgi:16S rRNA (guanine527-N7)-methyltransferase